MHKKQKAFLKLPEYPGGKEEFRKFIKENLKYPEEAVLHKIEGLVLLSGEIDGTGGEVKNIQVEKGIGYGCDEEAARLLRLMRFGGAKNRGVKVKSTRKFKINFKLPKKPAKTITYNIKKGSAPQPGEQQKKPASYSYSIKVKKK